MNSHSARSIFTGLFFFLWITIAGRAELAVTESWPSGASKAVSADAPLRLTFNEPVILGGSGKIEIHRVTDNRLMDAFDLGDAGFTNNFGGKTLRYEPFSVADNTASIQLHSHALNPGESYYVRISPEVFKGTNGDAFAGVTNNSAWTFATRAAPARGRTNLVVAADGSGDFCTPQGAVDYVSDDNQFPFGIFIRKGTYYGIVNVMADKGHIHFTGEDRKATIIAGRNNDKLNPGRIGRALVSVDGSDFTLENLTVHNLTPYRGSQAEALRVNANRCVLKNDEFYSFQDTLLLSGRVYATNCYVEGDVDFIWGSGTVFFDQCEIKAVHNGYYLQARNPEDRAGYIFNHCKLTAADGVSRCVLARGDLDRFPYSSVTFINCQMGPQVPAAGWEARGGDTSHLQFAEFHSTDADGKLIDVSQRLPASKQLTEAEAAEWSDPAKVFAQHDTWNPRASRP